jgi:hypothetical protein
VSLYDDLTVAPAARLSVATQVAPYIDASHLPEPGTTSSTAPRRRSLVHHGRPVTGRRASVDKSIPIAGGWPVARPTAPGRCSPSTGCMGSVPSDDDLLRSRPASGSDVPFALVGGYRARLRATARS